MERTIPRTASQTELEDFNLWRISTPEESSGEFTLDEFALAFQQLKPGKSPGPDSIYP